MSQLSNEATEALERAQEARKGWYRVQHTRKHQKAYKAFLDACRELFTILHTEQTSASANDPR